MTAPSARIIADSISPAGKRITTVEAVIWRPMLAEFNTHRALSRNSASSRAIPVAKLIELVVTDPAGPVVFRGEQRGMRGGAPLDPYDEANARAEWREAAIDAVLAARRLVRFGVHKSIVNRLLEPFLWHRVIITATEWRGFFEQRCHEAAQDDIRVVAEAIFDAMAGSAPEPIGPDDWHLPYVDKVEAALLREAGLDPRSISAARCANVSYSTIGNASRVYTWAEEEARFQKLVSAVPMHASPLEHVATPDRFGTYRSNFRGWAQYRHIYRAPGVAA